MLFLLDKWSPLLYFKSDMRYKNKKRSEFIFLVVVVLLALSFSLFIYSFIFQLRTISGKNDGNNQAKYTSHIVFAGTRSDVDMFNAFFEGASSVSKNYSAIIEKLLPTTMADERDLQTWLNYASYIDADGIIIFPDDEDFVIEKPVNIFESTIPVVSLVNSNTENAHVLFLGTNKYEIGKQFTEEIFAYEKMIQTTIPTVLALVNTEKNISATDRVLASIQEEFNKSKNLKRTILTETISGRGVEPVSDEVKELVSKLNKEQEVKLILCFSANDTVMAAQALVDLNLTGEIGIIGLYENKETRTFIEKGIIFSVISFDAFSMGVKAMESLFSLIEQGYANNYGAIDLVVLRKEEVQ